MNFSTRTLLGWTTFMVIAALAMTSPASEASSWNTITLTWTAPGDDDTAGRAAQYDIRYFTSNISGTDTTTWWNQATQCADEPVPQEPGTAESFTVTGLQPSATYYFMIRTADEVPNWSAFSNVAVCATEAIPDTISPAAVRDLACFEQNGHFLLVLTKLYGSVALGTQREASQAPDELDRRGSWPIVFLALKSKFQIDGGRLS